MWCRCRVGRLGFTLLMVVEVVVVGVVCTAEDWRRKRRMHLPTRALFVKWWGEMRQTAYTDRQRATSYLVGMLNARHQLFASCFISRKPKWANGKEPIWLLIPTTTTIRILYTRTRTKHNPSFALQRCWWGGCGFFSNHPPPQFHQISLTFLLNHIYYMCWFIGVCCCDSTFLSCQNNLNCSNSVALLQSWWFNSSYQLNFERSYWLMKWKGTRKRLGSHFVSLDFVSRELFGHA